MAKQLFVDVLSPDGTIGIVTNIVSVAYNWQEVGISNNFEKPKAFTAGRFLCIHIYTDKREINMAIIDYISNPVGCQMFINDLELAKQDLQKVSFAIEVMHSDYSIKGKDFEMVCGVSPAQPI